MAETPQQRMGEARPPRCDHGVHAGAQEHCRVDASESQEVRKPLRALRVGPAPRAAWREQATAAQANQGERWAWQLRRMAAPVQSPLGVKGLCKKLGEPMDALLGKLRLCKHMHSLGDNFRRFLGPLEPISSQGWPRAGLLWEGDPRVLAPPVFCPRSHCLSRWGGRRGARGITEMVPRPGQGWGQGPVTVRSTGDLATQSGVTSQPSAHCSD